MPEVIALNQVIDTTLRPVKRMYHSAVLHKLRRRRALTIFLLELSHLKHVLSVLKHLIINLIEISQCCQLLASKMCYMVHISIRASR